MPVVYIWIADMGVRHRFMPMPVSMFCIDIHWTVMVMLVLLLRMVVFKMPTVYPNLLMPLCVNV